MVVHVGTIDIFGTIMPTFVTINEPFMKLLLGLDLILFVPQSYALVQVLYLFFLQLYFIDSSKLLAQLQGQMLVKKLNLF